MRLHITATVVAMAAIPALADQPGSAVDIWRPATDLPRTDSGKPAIYAPPPVLPRSSDDCLRAIPCGLRLLGNVQRNGAVELQVPALRW